MHIHASYHIHEIFIPIIDAAQNLKHLCLQRHQERRRVQPQFTRKEAEAKPAACVPVQGGT
jgi:hypothetical protein